MGPWYTAATVDVQVGQYIVPQQTCGAFPQGIEADSKLKTVRAFTIITPIIGGLLTFSLWLAPCLYLYSASSWKCTALTFMVLLTTFQGLTFLIFQSSLCTGSYLSVSLGECQWDQGSTANVLSVIFWFLTGLAMLAVGVPERPERPPTETQAVTYEKTTNPDGTTTINEVNVVKGTYVPQAQESA